MRLPRENVAEARSQAVQLVAMLKGRMAVCGRKAHDRCLPAQCPTYDTNILVGITALRNGRVGRTDRVDRTNRTKQTLTVPVARSSKRRGCAAFD